MNESGEFGERAAHMAVELEIDIELNKQLDMCQLNQIASGVQDKNQLRKRKLVVK